MKRYIDDFSSKLNRISFKTLEESKNSIYCLSEELDLIYVNPAWVNFAKENGASIQFLKELPIGKHIANTFSGESIKKFYTENYLKVLKTGKPWRNEYECSSKDEFRKFNQNTYPIKGGNGLIIINTLTINSSMKIIGRKAIKVVDQRYVNSDGFVTQCSNCRCTQRVNEPDIWDWVPEWVKETPENFSHSICTICFDYYWKN
ncbi:hypothetical protein [uncultured Polaribacter sp.]|uniref:hypothetical protein n=1 Tax=uncultured Polaribacter sp. TaxID=174711 RepID=UPI0026083AC6|nr:hypothetical protein [uncultured Polaribacter sp.]